MEPSETQKKEIFKIHRGLGHPLPNEFGRALKHAGMRMGLHKMGGQGNEMPCV